jgi:hypothetical protein
VNERGAELNALLVAQRGFFDAVAGTLLEAKAIDPRPRYPPRRARLPR